MSKGSRGMHAIVLAALPYRSALGEFVSFMSAPCLSMCSKILPDTVRPCACCWQRNRLPAACIRNAAKHVYFCMSVRSLHQPFQAGVDYRQATWGARREPAHVHDAAWPRRRHL